MSHACDLHWLVVDSDFKEPVFFFLLTRSYHREKRTVPERHIKNENKLWLSTGTMGEQ